MEAHQIVKQVHEAYPTLVRKLSRILGRCEELFHSHGRIPKTRNPLQSGNVSPVTHYIEYCHQYEAGEPGAGKMLNNRVHASLTAEFTECDLTEAEIHESLIDEHCDVDKWLVRFDIAHATPNQLIAFERECADHMEALSRALSKARAERRRKESGLKAVVGRNGK